MSANNTLTATAVVNVIKKDGMPSLRVYSPASNPEFVKYSGWFAQIKDSQTDRQVTSFLVKTTSKEVADALTSQDGKVAVLVGYLRNENLARKDAPEDWKAVFNVVEVR